MDTMPKVLLLTNIPNPYRIPLFNELSGQLKASGICLKVLFGASGYRRRQYKLDMNTFQFDYEILNSGKYDAGNPEKTFFTYSGLSSALKKENPDCIIVNGFSAGTLRVWWHSLFHPLPYIIWSGTIEIRGEDHSRLRIFQRKFLLRKASAFIAYGKRASEYLVSLGAPREKVFIARNTVDTTFFSHRADEERKNIIQEGPMRFIYVGFLSRKKNLMCLMEAIVLLHARRNDFRLELVGEGEDRALFEAFVQEKALEDIVSFTGYVQKDGLPARLAGSHCFVFPSEYDVWGLVVNEAMAAGLPVIASPLSGVTDDLVENNTNGFIVDFSNPKTVALKMAWLLDHPGQAAKMGEASRMIVEQKASIPVSAAGMVSAIKFVINAPNPSISG